MAAIYSFVIRIFQGEAAPPAITGMLGTYGGRIHVEAKRRPLYFIISAVRFEIAQGRRAAGAA